MLTHKNKMIRSYGKVTLEKQAYIRLEVVGHSSAKIVDGPDGTTVKVNKLIKQLKQERKSVDMLMNISKVVSTDSTARSHVMSLGERGVQRIAVVGLNRFIRPIVPYVLRVLKKTTEVKFFSNESEAVAWLTRKENLIIDSQDKRSYTAPLYTVIALSILSLFGWSIDNTLLTTFIPNSDPLNPLVAILLSVLSIGLIIYYTKSRKKSAEWAIVIPSVALVMGGIVVGLRPLLGYDYHIDQLFFSTHNGVYIESARIKIGTAFSMIIVGILVLFVLAKKKFRIFGRLYYTTLLLLQLYFVVILILYGLNIYIEQVTLLSSFPAAVLFVLMSYSLCFIGPNKKYARNVLRATQRQWPAIVVFIIFFIGSCFGWQYTAATVREYSRLKAEAQFRTVQTTLDFSLSEYVESLSSLRGFFYASNEVDASEFKKYASDSNLMINNPGLSSVAYISYLKPSEVGNHEKLMRSRNTDEFPEYKTYKVFPINNDDHVYSLTYSEPKNINGAFGYNLASDKTRNETLTEALRTGNVQVSETVDLNESKQSGEVNLPGFFFTIPLYREVSGSSEPTTIQEREARIYGFINAYFRQDVIFKEIFSKLPREIKNDEAINLYVRNSIGHDVVYSLKKSSRSFEDDTVTGRTILHGKSEIAGNRWSFSLVALPGYGVPAGANLLPPLTLASGLLLTVIATSTVMGLSRSKEQAVELARQMTEDLTLERNIAVENQKKEEAILSSIGDAVFAIDSEEKIVVFNPSTEKLTGYDIDDALGQHYKSILRFVYDGTDNENVGFIDQALKGHASSMNEETILITKNGKRIPVADSAAPIRDRKGKITGAIVVFRDVTEERALDRSKDEFVSIASHQLRTPLSSMNWYTEMLLNGDAGKINKEQESYLKEIYIGNRRMTELVSSLLDTSRLDLGKLDCRPEFVNLKELLSSLHTEMLPTIKEKNITYSSTFTVASDYLYTDPKLIRMILQNLLSNAIKYTPPKGSVDLHAEDAVYKTGKPFVRFIVKDTGYGIPAAQQSKLFSKMFRADNVLEMEGTGLGLYIVREAAHKLGGDVKFTSIENEGTTFIAEIPMKKTYTSPDDTKKEQ